MYPRLSDLIQDIFGIYVPLPIQTYGFLVALAFTVGAIVAYYEIKRKEKEGVFLPFFVKEKIGEPAKISELIISFVIGWFLGYKLGYGFSHYNEFVINPQTFLLSKEGSLVWGIIIGLLSAAYVWWDKHKKKLPKPKLVGRKVWPHELVGNLIVVAGIWGLIGAKIFHILAHIKDEFLIDPWGSIFSFGGLAFYGGFIVGFIAAVLYLRKYNINIVHILDITALVMSVSYAVGRIGCQLSGDGCWGIVNTAPKPKWLSFLPDWMWAYNYPHNVINEGIKIPNCNDVFCHVLAQPVFPTPVYESLTMFFVFFLLWSLRKKIKVPGTLFAIYLILAGLERFWIEFIRITPRYHFLGIEATQAQIISFIMIILGIVGLIYISFKPERVLQLAKTYPKEINKLPKNVEQIIEN